MRIIRSSMVATLGLVVPVAVCWAGSYERSKDELSGRVIEVYQSPMKDSLFSSLKVLFAQYDASDGKLTMLVQGLGGDIQCDRYPIRLKSADGTIHQIDGKTKGIPPVCIARIPADWVKSTVTIETVIWGRGLLTLEITDKIKRITLNTSDLDLSRIALQARAGEQSASVATSQEGSSGDVTNEVGSCVNGSAGTVAERFTIKVIGVEWKDKILRPGMENVPAQHLETMGAAAYLVPKQSFLAVRLQITNITNAPFPWEYSRKIVPVYYAIGAQGAKFEPSGMSSDIYRNAHVGNLNPGIPADGTVVFDVPKGSYHFETHIFVKEKGSRKVFDCTLGI